MKAWRVFWEEEHYNEIVYAETPGKARSEVLKRYLDEDLIWVDVKVRRWPKKDGEPHTLTPLEYLMEGFYILCEYCGDEVYPDGDYVATTVGNVYHPDCPVLKGETVG